MNPDATSAHVLTPILVRAQLVMCGIVLATGATLAGFGAVDLDGLRSLFF